jgi:hypothetical protein
VIYGKDFIVLHLGVDVMICENIFSNVDFEPQEVLLGIMM